MRAHEFIEEGGWASTATQGTKITPQLVARVMQILVKDFIPKLNTFLNNKGLGPTEISAPGGSATYFERDLIQNPEKEYGDVDVQFHIPRIEGTSNNANANIFKEAIKEFCNTTDDYSTDNGTNVILKSGNDFVQVDLVSSYYENKEWSNVLRPEHNVKGVLCNSLLSSLGEAINLSIGGGHGVQAKFQNNNLVPFRTVKDVELKTVTNKPKTWAVDVVRFFGCKKLSNRLQSYPGLVGGEVRVSDIINSIRSIAETLEMNNKLPASYATANDMLKHIKSVYLDKINKVISSSKFDKAVTPDAIEKAEHTKHMLADKSQEFARMIAP